MFKNVLNYGKIQNLHKGVDAVSINFSGSLANKSTDKNEFLLDFGQFKKEKVIIESDAISQNIS